MLIMPRLDISNNVESKNIIAKLSPKLSTRNAKTNKNDNNTLPEPKSIVPSSHSSYFKSTHYSLLPPPPPPPPYETVVAAITSNNPHSILSTFSPLPCPLSIHRKSISMKRERKSRKQPHELLTEEEKKANHIVSEQKRRQNIRMGFDQLIEYVPTLNRGNRSETIILQKSIEHIRQLIIEKNELKNQIRDLQSILGDTEYEKDSSDEDFC